MNVLSTGMIVFPANADATNGVQFHVSGVHKLVRMEGNDLTKISMLHQLHPGLGLLNAKTIYMMVKHLHMALR